MSNHTYSIIWWTIAISTLVIWDFAWRGASLWRAVHNKDKAWFAVLLVINSVGILPIIYLSQHPKITKGNK